MYIALQLKNVGIYGKIEQKIVKHLTNPFFVTFRSLAIIPDLSQSTIFLQPNHDLFIICDTVPHYQQINPIRYLCIQLEAES